MQKKRIFSGVQPSGDLTIGNYLGALKQWTQKQADYDCLFCVVDLHAITVPQDPKKLLQKSREVAALYIACSIDPQAALIFIQSHVKQHAELGWILTCQSPLGWLNRMTQFKDKASKQQQDSVGSGLLIYPALMAADILLYQTHAVPVGDDQRQHLEFTRDLAQRFNHSYGETFTIPELMLPEAGARVMGLDNPLAKMSKSEATDNHAVYLLDDPDKARKKIMRAVTDSYNEIRFSTEDERAGVNNLLTIYQSITSQDKAAIEADFVGKGYGDLKRTVADAVVACIEPIQSEYARLTDDASFLDGILNDSAERATELAESTMKVVRDRLGFAQR